MTDSMLKALVTVTAEKPLQSYKILTLNKTNPSVILRGNHVDEEIMAGVLLPLNLYLAVVTMWYQLKHGTNHLRKTNSLCTVMVFSLLLRTIMLEIRLRTGHIASSYCNGTLIVSFFFYGLAKSLPYMVLWVRQKLMYTNPSQTELNTTAVKIASWVTFTGIIVFQVILTVTQMVYTRFDSSPTGCHLINKKKFGAFFAVASPALFAGATTFQLTLLGLVLYPLATHLLSKNFKHENVKRLVLRLAFSTSICILSDVLFLVINNVRPPRSSITFTELTSCFDTGFNMVAVLFSFTDYGIRFVPWQTCHDEDNDTYDKAASTSQNKVTTSTSVQEYGAL